MNYHMPQSLQTHEELKQITMVPTQIISPGTSKPCMAINIDTVIGAYLLTNPETKITKQQFQNLLTFSPYYNGNLPEPAGYFGEEPYWLGKQIVSMILPDISITHLKDVKIIRGEMTDGFLSEASLGMKPSAIINQIYNVYGTKQMTKFMNDMEKLVTRWFVQNSFSISFGDAVIKKELRSDINKIITETIQDAYDIIIRAQQGIYALDLDDSLRAEKLEADMGEALSNVSEKVKKFIGQNISKKNGFKEAIDSGATKGDMGHITNIMALVGKQDVWGKRIPSEFTYRTLPHFPKYDLSPESKGFSKDGLILGMNPADSFFGAMSGRNGKIDTAIKTADSGYTSRKFVKATEDIVVAYDLTVRNAANVIVQFTYGDDNMNPSKIEKITKIDLMEMDNEELKNTYQFEEVMDRGYWETFMTKDAVDEMMKEGSYIQLIEEEYEKMIQNRDTMRHKFFKNVEMIGDIGTYVPINIQRLIQASLINFHIEKNHLSDLTPKYIVDKFNEVIQYVINYFPEKDNSCLLQRMIFKSYLSPKRVLKEYRMNKMMFDYIIEMIKLKMMNSIITPGETVGVIAAQTLGEGTTQMTLNTFHAIGKKASVVTEGLPRLNEIIKLTKNMKNKNMIIYLKDEYSHSKEEAKKVKTKFAYTKLKDILSESEIIYTGNESYTDTDEEREFIRSYSDFSKLFGLEVCEKETLSPWMIRFIFDKEAMLIRNISVLEIQEKIKQKENDDIECVFSDDSASNVVMRIQFKKDPSGGSFLEFMREIEKQLSEMTIRGIDGIELADTDERSRLRYNADGSYVNDKEWIITTRGSNIMDIMSDPAVDPTRTMTNDIIKFTEIFGIEAARNLLCIEYGKVYQSQANNVRHIELISDVMSYRGKLMQIDRHGTNKNPDIGPLGKASFEAVMDVFTKAALFAEKDNMRGTSANIFAGQFCKAGTNMCEIIMDDEKLMMEVPMNEDYKPEEFIREADEEEVDAMMEDMFKDMKLEEDVHEEDFNFGLGLEEEKQSVLTGPSHVKFITKSKDGRVATVMMETMNMEDKLEIPEYQMEMNSSLEVPEYGNKKENNKLNVPEYKEEVEEEKEDLMVPDYGEEEEEEKVEEVVEVKKKTKKAPAKKSENNESKKKNTKSNKK